MICRKRELVEPCCACWYILFPLKQYVLVCNRRQQSRTSQTDKWVYCCILLEFDHFSEKTCTRRHLHYSSISRGIVSESESEPTFYVALSCVSVSRAITVKLIVYPVGHCFNDTLTRLLPRFIKEVITRLLPIKVFIE